MKELSPRPPDDFEITRATWGLCNISGLSEEEYDRIFLPPTGDTREARKYCYECELRERCKDYGSSNNRDGIWGGLNGSQLRRLNFRRKADSSLPIETVSEPYAIGESSVLDDDGIVDLVLAKGSCMNSGLSNQDIRKFFIECSGGVAVKAKVICFGCPILDACGLDASDRNVAYGVQAGLSAKERRAPKRKNIFEAVSHGKNIVELALNKRQQV